MAQIFKNNANSTLAAGISAVDTTIIIASGQGARFPVIASPDFCFCTLEDASGNIEIVQVTAHTASSTSFTVTRAQQGTSARSWALGDLFELRHTATEATEWESDIDDLEATRALKAGDTYTGTHDFSGATAVTLPANTSIGLVSATELGYLDGVTSSIQTQLTNKGTVTGQTWTGTHTFPSTTSIGNVSATEIAYLDGVTGAIQTQLDGKADTTGESYSGTHDFTAATVNVETALVGQSGSRAASLDFVNATALSSSLPGQTGNAGKYLSTDGTNPDWYDLPTTAVNKGGTGATNAVSARSNLGVPSTSEVYGLAQLTYVAVSGTSATAAAKQFLATRNAGLTTITGPASATSGDVWALAVCNGRVDNVINWNGLKHEDSSEATTTLDEGNRYYEFRYVDSSFGWKVK